MAKVDYRQIKPEERRAMLEQLAELFLTVRTKKEAAFLLERLLTESEIVMLVRRLKVAELLLGGLTHEDIREKLGVGMSTIRDVDGWLTDAAYEYHLIRDHQRKLGAASKPRARQHKVIDDLPMELQRTLRGDTRFILFRLLLGDF